jgi:23S rRNA G2445 N2-methylase RlmL
MKKSDKKLRLWDPFCGSGTILLETFSMFLDLPIREPFEKDFNCKVWPVFDKNGFLAFKKSMLSENKFEINPGYYFGLGL